MALSTIRSSGVRNLAINGAMQVAQRGTSASNLGADTAAQWVVDRTFTSSNSGGRYTASQNTVTDLTGFTKSLKLACTTADTSIAADEYFLLQHRWEGQDLQHLKKGTSDAETLTLSFYVKGNAAATYTAELYDFDNARTFSQRFNVTTSWNRISLTYAGDTTGAFDNDTALSLIFLIWLHSGSTYNSGTQNTGWAAVASDTRANSSDTSFFDSTSRTFEITGLQLEVGGLTDFEHRSYADELHRSRRYYQKILGGTYFGGFYAYTGSTGMRVPLVPAMRAAPTVTNYAVRNGSNGATASNIAAQYGGIDGFSAPIDGAGGSDTHFSHINQGYLEAQAEL